MFIYKKKNYSYLYIFFLILVFIFNEFSTKDTLAKNFDITQVKIEENYNINFDKHLIIDKAFQRAFNILIYKILEKKDRSKINNISNQEIKRLIENFSIIEEKFIDNNYIGHFDVQFNRKKVLKLIESKGAISSSASKIETLLLPILLDASNSELYHINQNIFLKEWNKKKEKHFLINYVLPNDDIEDYFIIKKNIKNLENYDFIEILKKYNSNNHIILILQKNENQLKIFSRIKFDKDNMIINRIENNIDINNNDSVNKLINVLKDDYEDKWKSINKINTSIILPVRLSLNSKDYNFIKKIENILSQLDYVSNFRIEKFDNDKIIYKVIFNNSPKKFIEKMSLLNFKINTSNDIWVIK